MARQFAFPGTTTLFGGIYDQVEGVACHFGPASDGSLRCLPDMGEAGDAPERWVLGVQMPPLFDTSDRFLTISEWYLVTRRSLEQTPEP